MTLPPWSRPLPGLVVLALFALVAATPAPPVPNMYPPPAPCSDYSQASPGASTASFQLGDGVTQPLEEGVPVLACSLHVAASGWSFLDAYVREWDPVALAPDPSTIALRTSYIDPSRMNYYITNSAPWVILSPPLISRSVAGVAEPPRTTVAMELRSKPAGFTSPMSAHYEQSGDAAIPQAQSVSNGGSHDPLLGTHPVMGHAVCPGSPDLQALRVVQSVKTTNAPLSAHPPEIVQRFRVPEPVDLRWIELAVNGYAGPLQPTSPATATQDGIAMPVVPSASIGIVDGTSFGAPPSNMPSTLVEALFESPYNFFSYSYTPPPRWASHYGFDHAMTLYPDHDYWLYIRFANNYEFLGRTLTGTESSDFQSGIGPLYTRTETGTPWTAESDRVLAFKVIGRPTAPVGVSPQHPANPFRLAASPNPSNGPLRVEWSGAVGPVKLEVLDARGRRLARGEGGAAGSWMWSMSGRDGRPLAAGVYFVRARDSAGELSSERVVLVR